MHLIVPPADFRAPLGLKRTSRSIVSKRETARHRFCRHCGVQSFYTPRSHPDQISVNVRCLDGEGAQAFDVQPFDGANWEKNVVSIR